MRYATYSRAACCFGAVLDRRGIRRLGFAWIPHRTRPARAVPRAVLQGWARPRRGAVGALARLLPAPRPDRLLRRSQVAGWQPAAFGDHGSAPRTLFSSSFVDRPIGWNVTSAVTFAL